MPYKPLQLSCHNYNNQTLDITVTTLPPPEELWSTVNSSSLSQPPNTENSTSHDIFALLQQNLWSNFSTFSVEETCKKSQMFNSHFIQALKGRWNCALDRKVTGILQNRRNELSLASFVLSTFAWILWRLHVNFAKINARDNFRLWRRAHRDLSRISVVHNN